MLYLEQKENRMFKLSDRVKQTSTTTGTNDIVFASEIAGFQTFAQGVGDGNSTYYAIENHDRFEIGIGTYTSSTNTLSRDTVLISNNSNNKIILDGVSSVFVTYPAAKSVNLDSSGFITGFDAEYAGIKFPDGTTQSTAGGGGTGQNYYVDEISLDSSNILTLGRVALADLTVDLSGLSSDIDIPESGNWNTAYDVLVEASGNWNTAYGWGDHSLAGYLTTISIPESGNWNTAYSTLVAQSGNWNTAYGWGDHSTVGYLTEINIPESGNWNTAYDTLVQQSGNWNTAYSWGDHSVEGYLTTINIPESGNWNTAYDTLVAQSGNWNTAYSWGDHSVEGYLTSFTEANDLSAAVTWDTVPDLYISESSVVQHSGAMRITESQIVDLQTYLTAHPSITNNGSSNSNTGNTFIQNITLDSNGHVTNLSVGVSTAGEDVDGIASILEDTTPQLGGQLDANGYTIDMGNNIITDAKVGQWDTSYSTLVAQSGNWNTAYSTLVEQSGNWNTAYSWGDHSVEGYLTTINIPESGNWNTAYDTLVAQSGNWNTAYSWGDHSIEGYLTEINIPESGNWNTAYDTLVAQSGNWNTSYDTLVAQSGNWNTAYDTLVAQSGNWNTAYSWGDHSVEGYLTTINIPESGNWNTAYDTLVAQSGNWNTAYSWGDHSVEGYLTEINIPESGNWNTAYDVLVEASGNWNTAYGWGDHSTAGYLTSFTETLTTLVADSGNQKLVYTDEDGSSNDVDLSWLVSTGLTGNGSSNYVARWTSSSTLGTGILYDSGSKVGIDTTSPSSKLHIVGDGSTTDEGIINVEDSSSGGTTSWIKLFADDGFDDLTWHIAYGDTSIFKDLEFRTSFSSVPEVTIFPSGTLNVDSTGTSTKRFTAYDFYSTTYNTAALPAYTFANDLDTGMWLASANNLCFSTAGTERLRITSAGNVAIATTAATEKLQIQGNIRLSNGGIGTDNDGVHMAFPGNGSDSNSASVRTGYLKVQLPVGWTNTMISFDLYVYEYNANGAAAIRKLRIGGYNYTGGGGQWIRPIAVYDGDGVVDHNLKVHFGYDGTYSAIYISKMTTAGVDSGASSSWSYPQAFVANVFGGYSATTMANWADGWDIDYTTALGTISQTLEVNRSFKLNDSSYVFNELGNNVDVRIESENLDYLIHTDASKDEVVIHNAVGYGLNYATPEGWIEGNGTQVGYYGGSFNRNGASAENFCEFGDLPNGMRGLLWKSRNNTTDNGADGGWTKNVTGVDPEKTYVSIVYVRRVGSSTTGNFYHGCGTGGSATYNMAGVSISNPYFHAFNIANLPQDVWCVSIGIIHAHSDSTTTSTGIGGVYRLDSGVKLAISNQDYRMGPTTTVQNHRTFLYYDTVGTSALDWCWPGFYEVTADAVTGLLNTILYDHFSGRNIVVNATEDNYDFRVAGDTESHLLFTDASTDRVGIKTFLPQSDFDVAGSSSLRGNVILGDASVPLVSQPIKVTEDTYFKTDVTVAGTGVINTLNINSAFTLPTSDGSPDQVLVTDGAGSVTWADQSASGGGGSVDPAMTQARMTLTTNLPVTYNDVTSSTIYYTPFRGNKIALYDGSEWALHTLSEISFSLSALTVNNNYDMFIYDNSGTLTLEAVAWSTHTFGSTTRAVALATQDGVYVKSGDATKKYIGSFRTLSPIGTRDADDSRLLWNYYNRVPKRVRCQLTTTSAYHSWTYNSITVRAIANNTTIGNGRFVIMNGVIEDTIDMTATSLVNGRSGSMTTTIGYNSNSSRTSTIAAGPYSASGAASPAVIAMLVHTPNVGYHYYQQQEHRNYGSSYYIAYARNTAGYSHTGIEGEWTC